jgi:DNA-directed RNA polymerase subunit alpha
VAGVPALATIAPRPIDALRARRAADRALSPLIDASAETYRVIYANVSDPQGTSPMSFPFVAVTGDEAALVATGPGEITAADIDLPSGVEILNPNIHIATLEKKARLEFYMTIGRGRGYRPAEENKSPDQPIGVIPIDSIFSPVRRVAYNVEQARVGQRTDFDKLTLDIETDGSVDPQAALREAAELLISQLAIFTDEDRIEELRAGPAGQLDGGLAGAAGVTPLALQGEEWGILIEELELGVRSYNCLKRAGIQTVGDLISKSEAELNAIPNFGKKSIDEVIETLEARGLNLRDD